MRSQTIATSNFTSHGRWGIPISVKINPPKHTYIEMEIKIKINPAGRFKKIEKNDADRQIYLVSPNKTSQSN